jgi:hypothetical protein
MVVLRTLTSCDIPKIMSLYIPPNIDETLGFNIRLHAKTASCVLSKSSIGALFIVGTSDSHFPPDTPPEKMIIVTGKEHFAHPEGVYVFRKATLTHTVSGHSLSDFLRMKISRGEACSSIEDENEDDDDMDPILTYSDETGKL